MKNRIRNGENESFIYNLVRKALTTSDCNYTAEWGKCYNGNSLKLLMYFSCQYFINKPHI